MFEKSIALVPAYIRSLIIAKTISKNFHFSGEQKFLLKFQWRFLSHFQQLKNHTFWLPRASGSNYKRIVYQHGYNCYIPPYWKKHNNCEKHTSTTANVPIPLKIKKIPTHAETKRPWQSNFNVKRIYIYIYTYIYSPLHTWTTLHQGVGGKQTSSAPPWKLRFLARERREKKRHASALHL